MIISGTSLSCLACVFQQTLSYVCGWKASDGLCSLGGDSVMDAANKLSILNNHISCLTMCTPEQHIGAFSNL